MINSDVSSDITRPTTSPGGHVKALICGLPEALTGYCLDLCKQVLAPQWRDCAAINVNTLPQETLDRISQADGPTLLWADSPDADTVAFARNATFPVVVLHSDFALAAQEFMHVRSVSLIDTLRVVGQAKAGLWQMLEIPSAHVLMTQARPDSEIREELARLLEVDLPAADSSLSETQVDVRTMAQQAHGFDLPSGLLRDTATIAAMAAFYGHIRPSEARRLEVPLCLLYSGVPPHDSLVEPTIELLGPQRALTFGPFVFMPQGNWTTTFRFATRQHAPANSYMFDVFADMEEKAVMNCNVDVEGEFRYECAFEVRNPLDTFEFRTHLAKGSIGGSFTLLSITVERP